MRTDWRLAHLSLAGGSRLWVTGWTARVFLFLVWSFDSLWELTGMAQAGSTFMLGLRPLMNTFPLRQVACLVYLEEFKLFYNLIRCLLG